jgi:NTP pyrophosphatase (non-canonical NTP hydrolase)|tara:strand:- start:1072 stop:1857 length:786 start_codon:yes stop_codon:yes gene_type:complete
MYYLYHIPGKKIGVTCNLNRRVTLTQGYNPDEYEVLDQSDDIDYISEKEIELQQSYGYKIDRKKYNELFKFNKKMKINVTEQTTTFPCPVNKLKGQLLDNIGMEWETEHGTLHITEKTVPWIMKNVKTSMYNNNRCYVYNKAFARLYDNNNLFSEPIMVQCEDDAMFSRIREWAQDRGLYDKGNAHTQYVKLQEEAGELAKALLKEDKPEIIDAIGDMVVVLTNLSHMQGVTIEHCIDSAYKVISKRTGKMINGTFVKDEN